MVEFVAAVIVVAAIAFLLNRVTRRRYREPTLCGFCGTILQGMPTRQVDMGEDGSVVIVVACVPCAERREKQATILTVVGFGLAATALALFWFWMS